MTPTNLSRDSANWWLMDFILDLPWSCLSSFNSSLEQVPTFYWLSTARERNQTKNVLRWHEQSCPVQFGQLIAHTLYSASTMISPELVWLLCWISANILPALDSSGKISSQGCLAMTWTRDTKSRSTQNRWSVTAPYLSGTPWQICAALRHSPPPPIYWGDRGIRHRGT